MPSLSLSNLDKRHPGVSHGIATSYEEAARVCLGRHHEPPSVFNVAYNSAIVTADAQWSTPSASLKDAWANMIDATEAAAYCIALAAAEITCGLVAVRRAETKSGADYYLAPAGVEPDDLENLIRLEVSGIDEVTTQSVASRLNQKLQQLRNGTRNLPGIASVVAFDQLAVVSADMT